MFYQCQQVLGLCLIIVLFLLRVPFFIILCYNSTEFYKSTAEEIPKESLYQWLSRILLRKITRGNGRCAYGGYKLVNKTMLVGS